MLLSDDWAETHPGVISLLAVNCRNCLAHILLEVKTTQMGSRTYAADFRELQVLVPRK